jgi:hypothetical protein
LLPDRHGYPWRPSQFGKKNIDPVDSTGERIENAFVVA